MANMTITNIDTGCVELEDGEFRDELLTFAAADTFVKGTILARQEVVLAITPSAVTGTGNGTVTLATVVAGSTVPKAGNYVLRNTEAVTNGGVWRLEDPNGNVVASGLRQTVGAGAATAFKAAGLGFTITDGATDFALGDTFTLPVVADGKLVPYAIAGAGGAQVPMAVLTYEVTRASGGNEPVRVLVSGKVKKERLVIDADGSGVNVSSAVLDALKHHSIVALNCFQLGNYDTQD